MIRLVRMGKKWYGLEVSVIDDQEVENIEKFVYSGEPVIFCSDLEEVDELLDINGVEMVGGADDD